MPRYSTNRELGKLAAANADRRDKAARTTKANPIPLPDASRFDNMKSAQPTNPPETAAD